ncbi:AAA family ATPase [Aliarcobacter lanthieri]|uniref:AAA family ATPase n=1 Tax=Aliarcobacter TaxID=2321111 RepID=UPI0029B60918|nr:AAA family ATPase [Aliarcobacter skirrowii]MDX4028570.1 AAA family ATPase [Aliarcobacter skirrowii]
MITLIEATIHKYKSIESDQTFSINDDVTILVGMNESGKTSAVEAIAKTNYFQSDGKFKFNTTYDYPRKEKKKMDKTGITPEAITLKFLISEELQNKIDKDIGKGVFTIQEFTRTTKYDNGHTIGNVKVDYSKFVELKTKELNIASKALNDKLLKVKSNDDLTSLIAEYTEDTYTTGLGTLKKYFENSSWNDPVAQYVYNKYLSPNLPKFLYYDEYYALPSKISIEELQKESLEEDELKTAKALFDLADIDIDELINSDEYEDYRAELEATEATITDELFKYWNTNNNLDIVFDIEKVEKIINNNQTRIIEHILNIRVKNNRSKVSLPLKNRSKGFNWFFSFLVWFKRIQEDKNSNYILLLDEPGLNLHASAQNDLLNFIEDLTSDYQIIYTTHSPFMIRPAQLNRVRTVVETENGTLISDSIQDKDPNTLFPLQAALGYDIAQNLFISEKNLLVEGVSDLIYLQVISNLLEQNSRTYLNKDITIVPVGGMDKVATFISLLRGSDLNIVCLLDSFIDAKSKAKLDDITKGKIINSKNIIYFDEFTSKNKSDIEDLFTKSDYLKLFNLAFDEYDEINEADLNSSIDRILIQISKIINKDRFNHYKPANQLTKMGVDISFFSNDTIDNFEKVFDKVNTIFSEKS